MRKILLLALTAVLGCSAHYVTPAEQAAQLNDMDWEIVEEPAAEEEEPDG